MKKILFFLFLLPAALASAQTAKDTVNVLTDAEISAGTLVDSVRIYYIQNGWKKSRLDSLAAYMQTKIGGGGGGGSGTVTSITAGAGLTGGTITTTGTIAADTTNTLVSKTFLNNNSVSSFSAGTTGLTPSTTTKGAVTLAGTLNVANGGTGATTASQARTNLGLAIGTDVLAPNGSAANLTSFPTLNQNTTGTAANVTGTVAIANGGTGATTQQGAINALAGATTSGQYLRGNGTNVSMSAIQAGDVPTLNQNTTGSAASLTTARDIQTNLASTSAASFNGTANIQPGVTGTLPIGNGGTGQTSYTDGQLLIGNTATGGLSKATLTAGSNVTITNGNGTITIAASGGGGGGSGVISGVVAGEVGYGIGADSLGGESALYYDATNNRLSVGGETSPTATMQVKGAGTTTGVGLLVENSAGSDKLIVRDNGNVEIGRDGSTTSITASIQAADAGESNIGIAIVPKGTGALTTQIPDGTNTNGNARGANAIDLQFSRSLATQVASGANSALLGGVSNQANSARSVVLGGSTNLISATGANNAAILGGQNNTISANIANSVIICGTNNIISEGPDYQSIFGGRDCRSIQAYTNVSGFAGYGYLRGQEVRANGQFNAVGDAQLSTIQLKRAIPGTAQTELFLDGDGATVRAVLPSGSPTSTNRLWNANIQLTAIVSVQGNGSVAVGNSFIGNYSVGIKRIGSATSLVGTVQDLHTPQYDSGMSTCVVTIDADDTNEALRIRFTPPTGAGTTTVIRVVATVYLTEVGY